MPSDAQRRRAILEHLTPATRTPDGQYLTLRFARYPDGHYAYGSPDDLQNCMNARGALEIVADFTRLIARWEREAENRRRRNTAEPVPVLVLPTMPEEIPSGPGTEITATPYTVTWFQLGENGELRSETAPTFEAALALLPSGPRGWERYRIMQGDLFIERGDPFGPRGAPSPLRRGEPAPSNEWWQREGEDL